MANPNTNFFDIPNALNWVRYYGGDRAGDASVQPTTRDFGGAPQAIQVTPYSPPGGTSTTTPIAGQNIWADIYNQLPPGLDINDKDDKDTFSKLMKWNVLQSMYENHPEIIRQRGQIYSDIQNQLADKAQTRAMQAHMFAGLLNLPNKWQEAMSEKYRFAPSTMEYVSKGMTGSQSPFVTRQYV